MKRISILGAGWLGSSLACHLKQKGHTIKASTTRADKGAFFERQGIAHFQVRVGTGTDNGPLGALLQDTDILIIAISPSFDQQSAGNDYLEQVRSVVPFIERHGIQEVIFTSSTTVYLSLRGEVDEEAPIRPMSTMDRQIVDIENMLLEHPAFRATILRLGALIGEDRHPVHHIVKRPLIEDANNPVNMVHRNDIVRFVEQMVTRPLPNEIFNVVAPIRCDRRKFYTQEALHLGLAPLPLFTDNPNADMRRVNGEKIAQRYGLAYEWLGRS